MHADELQKLRQQLIDLKRELEAIEETSRAAARPVLLDQQSVGRLSRMDAIAMQQIPSKARGAGLADYSASIRLWLAWRLLGISKRGDVYLRKLLIHGARAALRWADRKQDRRSRWVSELATRRGQNIAAVALANKTVCTAWVLMTREEEYRTTTATI